MNAGDDEISGVRAARLRLGLSQRQIAERLHVHVDTYQHWDKGRNRPSDPAMLQLLARVLETPLDVLYPPEANPRVARALLDLERTENPEPTGDSSGESTDALEPAPESPAELHVVETLDPRIATPPDPPERRRRARVAVLVAFGLTAALAVAIVAVGGSDDRATLHGSDAAAAEVARQDQKARIDQQARADLDAAADRGDFDRAISVASRIGDESAVSRYRTAAAEVLVRRASKAATRGDLPLARKRLRSASDRYGTAPGADAVRSRVRRIERDRRRRAAEQRRRARRQAAASKAPSPTTTAPAPPVQAPAAAPAPKPEPAPSTGSTRKPSREREQAVDPGLF